MLQTPKTGLFNSVVKVSPFFILNPRMSVPTSDGESSSLITRSNGESCQLRSTFKWLFFSFNGSIQMSASRTRKASNYFYGIREIRPLGWCIFWKRLSYRRDKPFLPLSETDSECTTQTNLLINGVENSDKEIHWIVKQLWCVDRVLWCLQSPANISTGTL